jgi:small subunit ribosomal protein S6
MRKYELMTVYPMDEGPGVAALEQVRAVLTEFGVEIEAEDVYGDRELTYEVNKQTRGHFVLMHLKAPPAKLADIDRRFKLNTGLLKYLFVRVDE